MPHRRYTEIGNSFYVYGIKKPSTLSARSPKLTLKLSILAPLSVRSMIEDVLNGQVDMGRPVHCPLVDTFSIQLDVVSRQVSLWNGNNHMEICIAPLN